MTRFNSKTAIVLGGSRGIGAAIVRRLCTEQADVVFTYAGSEDLARALESETGAMGVRSNIADRAETTAFFGELKSLDFLVVCAGVLATGDPLELPAEEIDRLIDVNVRGPYFAAVEAARKMSVGGRIILIGSSNGIRMPTPGGAAYAMSKAAVRGLAQGLARDFGERGITVNVVEPGPTDTDMNPADGPMHELMHSFMAIKRHALPVEVAGMVAYLLSEEAAIVTGSHMLVDGGFAA